MKRSFTLISLMLLATALTFGQKIPFQNYEEFMGARMSRYLQESNPNYWKSTIDSVTNNCTINTQMSNFKFNETNTQWYNYTNGEDVCTAVEEGEYLWIGTFGGLVKLHKATGNTQFFNRGNSGLPDNYVYSIAIDSDGNKWIGTHSGLAKFDGTNWTVYNTSNSGLPVNDVRCVAIDQHGTKWIGTDVGGLVKFDDTNWTVYNSANSGLPSDKITSISVDSNGIKWLGTYLGG
ncbi:MAG: two-component regulator propeller domain-containing protein, partial [Salinivirgaceae bacterium]|nr:two-component regulator propeller domain-containing protein [Salinivirgaceae bacterium]